MNENSHFIVNEPGDGDVLVSDVSGTNAPLEDDVCLVYGGNDGDYDRKLSDAERIAALLNSARGIPTFAFTGANVPGQHSGFSFVTLRETMRDLVQQFADNDSEGVEQSIALLEMNVSLLSGEG